jgi:hypothetical protein
MHCTAGSMSKATHIQLPAHALVRPQVWYTCEEALFISVPHGVLVNLYIE